MTCGDDTLVIGTHNGMAIHFRETDVRPMGRVTHGVRGIHLGGGDYVVGMARAVARRDAALRDRARLRQAHRAYGV